MKRYEDIADSILRKYNQKLEMKKRRKERIRRTVCAGAGLCAAAAICVTAASPDIIRHEPTGSRSGFTGTETSVTVTAQSSSLPVTEETTVPAAETTAPAAEVIVTDNAAALQTTTLPAETTVPVTSSVTTTTAELLPEKQPLPERVLTLRTEKLIENVTADGITLPENAYAVTVSVENNTGFSLLAVRFDTGEGTVLTDTKGRPIVTAEGEDAPVAVGSVNGGTTAFAVSSGHRFIYRGVPERRYSPSGMPYTESGELFTFYTTAEVPQTSLVSFEFDPKRSYSSGSTDVYMIGDLNGDGDVTLADCETFKESISRKLLGTLSYAQLSNSSQIYFPDIVCIDAAFIWNKPDELIKYPISFDTADELLAYCADKLAGRKYSGDSYLGYKYRRAEK